MRSHGARLKLAPVIQFDFVEHLFKLPSMASLFGRFFQLVGMIILPIGLLIGLLRDDVALEVRLLFIGGAFFLVGWLMARKK